VKHKNIYQGQDEDLYAPSKPSSSSSDEQLRFYLEKKKKKKKKKSAGRAIPYFFLPAFAAL
jgi:hypothetical protein